MQKSLRHRVHNQIFKIKYDMKQIFFIIGMLFSQILISQDQMYDVCPLKVGAEIPNINLTDDNNKQISLTNLTADKPSVFIFYRGAWCGYCTKHLAELNDIKEDVEQLGYQMLGITIDQAEKLAESTKRSESEIQVYSDSKLEATKAFGLDWKVDDELFNKYKNKYQLDLEEWSGEDHHSLTVPAIFVIKDNIITFPVSYTHLPSPRDS